MSRHFPKLLGGETVHSNRIHPAQMNFMRGEDGSVTILALFLFLIILATAGIGVDLMHYERNRADLQATLDRAVLAAADLDQKMCGEDVVENYMDKAGLGHLETTVTVDPPCDDANTTPLGYRTVEATATMHMATDFMKLSGVDVLSSTSKSVAQESIGNIEISLVLDVSGSMNRNSKIANLRSAAHSFIDQMIDNTEDGNLSMSIVPYASQVALPETFFNQFNTSGLNRHARCINFSTDGISNDFTTTTLNANTERPRTMHLNPWWYAPYYQTYDARYSSSSRHPTVAAEVCSTLANHEILVMQKNRTTLKDYVTDLTATGATSIDVGLKWGTALLDPSLNSVIRGMRDDDSASIPVDFEDRPANYSNSATGTSSNADEDTLKVIVLMTDGENTEQGEILAPYREGDTPIFWNEEAEVYSTYDEENNRYYWHTGGGASGAPFGQYHDHAYGNGTYTETETTGEWVWKGYWDWVETTTTTEVDEPGEAEALTYPELWESTTAGGVRDLQAQWLGSSEAQNRLDQALKLHDSQKDAQAKSLCNAAKSQGVIVYTVAFEAPAAGQALLSNCASSTSHYYLTSGSQIVGTFESIASSIRKLRLTQ